MLEKWSELVFLIITKFLCLEVSCAHDDSVTDINSRLELLSPEPLVPVWRVICYILVFYFSFLAVCEIFVVFLILFFGYYFLLKKIFFIYLFFGWVKSSFYCFSLQTFFS